MLLVHFLSLATTLPACTHRLEKDMVRTRIATYTGRKSLEGYWCEQVKLRKHMEHLEAST